MAVIDLCVDKAFRNQGIASALIQEIEALAGEKNIGFLVLMAKNRRLYEKSGFKLVSCSCTWLRIHEHATLGVADENLAGKLMVKEMGRKTWPIGDVDFLGYLYLF